MMLQESQRKYIETKFSELFSEPKVLEKLAYEESSEWYKEVVHDALQEEKFPSEATHLNVDYDFVPTSKIEMSKWVDLFIEDHEVYDMDVYDGLKDDNTAYKHTLMNHDDQLDVSIHLKEDVTEWVDQNPTVEGIERYLEDGVLTEKAIELIPTHSPSFQDRLREAMLEDGFNADTDTSKLDYEIEDLKFSMPPSDLADIYIQKARQYGKFNQYLRDQLYIDLVGDDSIVYDIDIESDPEAFNK